MENKSASNTPSGQTQEKLCHCNDINIQSDAEVILPDQSCYCMLCGHKKKLQPSTKDNNDDDDDVIIVKEEKRHGVPKNKSNNAKTVSISNDVDAQKSLGENKLPKAQKSLVENKLPKIIFTSSSNDSTFMQFKLPAAKTKEKMKKPSLVSTDSGGIKNVSQTKSKVVIPSNSEFVKTAIPSNSESVKMAIPSKSESVKTTKDGKIPNKPTNKRKLEAGSSKQNSLVKKKKNSVEKTSIEQRKSKRVKKVSSKFSDCVTLNLDTESESSDGSDDSSENEDDSDDGYASPLDMLDEENMCKVCMSYEPPIEFEQGCDVASFELKWIDCDGCHRWFHWFCVGIFDENDTQFFKCKTCRSQHV